MRPHLDPPLGGEERGNRKEKREFKAESSKLKADNWLNG